MRLVRDKDKLTCGRRAVKVEDKAAASGPGVCSEHTAVVTLAGKEGIALHSWGRNGT